MRVGALVCLLFAGIVACVDAKSYRGYHVFSTKADNQEQLKVLQNLEVDDRLTFLLSPSMVQNTQFVVPMDAMEEVQNTLEDSGMSVRVQAEDLQDQIDADKKDNLMSRLKQRSSSTLPQHDAYYKLWQVKRFMSEFQKRHPELALKKKLPKKTYEGRTVYYMEIGTRSQDKPVIFIEALCHCREWVTTASMIYAIDKLLHGYSTGNERIKAALTKYTWIFIPVTNPDGYVYTWADDGDRLWRKNRRPINERCTGVDLNRNFDMEFGTTGVSNNCSWSIFHGTEPFSEAETQNIKELFETLKHRIVAFLSVHAYSKLLLHPWTYLESMDSENAPENDEELARVGNTMLTALNDYRYGTPMELIGYAASGSSIDWALYQKPGIYSYAYELRPKALTLDSTHFELPPDQIIPTGEEFMQSLLLLSENMVLDEGQGE